MTFDDVVNKIQTVMKDGRNDILHLTNISMTWCVPVSWKVYNKAWIGNYTHYKVWDEITHPFLNFNGATVEV